MEQVDNSPRTSLEDVADNALEALKIAIADVDRNGFRTPTQSTYRATDNYNYLRDSLSEIGCVSDPLVMIRANASIVHLDRVFLEYAIGSSATNVLSNIDLPLQHTDKNNVSLISAISRKDDGDTYMSIASLALEFSRAHNFDAILHALDYVRQTVQD